jgi:gluconate 2-dehydrogenase gamma chain
MAGWKPIGFRGARYDYRHWVERHNEVYPLPPVSITGRSDRTVRQWSWLANFHQRMS